MSKLHFTLSIIDDKKMQELNKKHRGIDFSTDVLSFELSEQLPDGTKLMGDIVVDEEYAKRQAKELGHSVEEEIAFLVAHGAMHLMGVHHDGDDIKPQISIRQSADKCQRFKSKVNDEDAG